MEKVPGAHVAHAVAPAADHEPPPQLVEHDVALLALLAVPAGHGEHDGRPDVAVYLPAVHAGQLDVRPVALEAVPALH